MRSKLMWLLKKKARIIQKGNVSATILPTMRWILKKGKRGKKGRKNERLGEMVTNPKMETRARERERRVSNRVNNGSSSTSKNSLTIK